MNIPCKLSLHSVGTHFRNYIIYIKMKKLFIIILTILQCSLVTLAQGPKKTAMVKGRLINAFTKSPMSDKKVIIQGLDVFATSDGEGKFDFSEIPYGNQTIEVTGSSVISVSVIVNVDKPIVEVADISVTPNDNNASVENVEIPTIAIEDNNTSAEDDGAASQNASGMMVATRDPFISALAYVFGAYYFQPRGANRNGNEVQINGITVNDLESGNASWSQLGGLNDVFHSRSVTYGLAPSGYTFGGIGGSTYFNATAADQRKETQVTYTASNRNYHNRIMLTYNTGLMSNGWAYSVSVSRRWAEQGYQPGTFYDGNSYYAAVSKVIGKGQINLTTFGSPTVHGKVGAATMEDFNLSGNNYFNPNWGYQNGKVRNATVGNTFQPNTILNYEYKPNENTRWNTAIGYEFGKDMSSNLYSYNGSSSVIGSYYRNLPNYNLNITPPNPTLATTITSQIKANPNLLQIDWNSIYQGNYLDSIAAYNVGGTGKNYIGRLSSYILGNKVNDLNKLSFNSNIEHSFTEKLTISGGISVVSQQTETYNQVADLLGGDFFINYNAFPPASSVPSPNYSFYNLANPDPYVKTGDKWDYDYVIHLMNANLWGQAVYNIDKFDFFLSGTVGDYSFYRDGLFQNGVFPTRSYGNSSTNNFLTYGAKGGIDFKFDARNVLFLNAGISATPPTADNTYVSPQTRDYTVMNPTVQTNNSIEGGYFMKGKDLSIRIDGYANESKNVTQIKRFYNDDPSVYTYVNYIMQGVNTRSLGTEIAINAKIHGPFSITAVAAIGQAFYTDEPNVTMYLDNDTTQHAVPSKTYIKNYYLSVGPQSAYTLGLNYRDRGWFCTLNFNYMDRNYIDINPNRRTTAAAGFAQPGSTLYHEIMDQEMLPSYYTVDLHAGKNIQLSRLSKTVSKISKDTYLNVNLGVSNLLNNTHIISYGYEQLRYDFTGNTPNMFPNKYLYAMGINFFLNVVLRF